MSRDGKLALAIFAGSLFALLVLSAHSPLGPANSDYAALVNQAENAVRGVASDGFAFFASASGKHAIEQLSKRPLVPLLSAWSALSLGRIGVLDGSTSVRLPWLVLAAIAPACIFLQLRARLATRSAIAGAAWLVASPGFVASALAVSPAALPAWSGWAVLTAASRAANARRVGARCAWVCAAGGFALVACGLSFAVLWLVPLVVAHTWLARGGATLQASERGSLPISAAAAAVLCALPLGVLLFDPLLWHVTVPSMIFRLFEEEDAVNAGAVSFGSLVLPAVLALAGAVALAHAALARLFATGEFRPRRDCSQLGLTLLLAGLTCALLSSADLPLSNQLLRPILACLVGLGAVAIARRWFSRYAIAAELALLASSLLVR